MGYVLDNPIWHALISGSRPFAYGTNNAKYIKRDLGLFAGLRNNNEQDLIELHALLPAKSNVILFSPSELSIPTFWRTHLKKDLLQMVYSHDDKPAFKKDILVPLGEAHIPAMMELTALTKPGPFLSRTIEFGNYEGIFSGKNLVAMAGQRLRPDPYTEISAVCTHPDHTGKGYAASLIASQVSQLLDHSRIPFLHLNLENEAAFRLYDKLGFEVRKQMLVYVLETQV